MEKSKNVLCFLSVWCTEPHEQATTARICNMTVNFRQLHMPMWTCDICCCHAIQNGDPRDWGEEGFSRQGAWYSLWCQERWLRDCLPYTVCRKHWLLLACLMSTMQLTTRKVTDHLHHWTIGHHLGIRPIFHALRSRLKDPILSLVYVKNLLVLEMASTMSGRKRARNAVCPSKVGSTVQSSGQAL